MSDAARSALRDLPRLLRDVALGLVAATLPAARHRALAERFELNVPAFSMLLGLIELPLGIGLFVNGGLIFMRGGSLAASLVLLENWTPALSTTDFQGAGLLNWLAWFLHPAAWVFGGIALVGGARCVAFVASRETFPEPVVWAAIRLWEAASGGWRTRIRRRQFGPDRPDRILNERDGGITLLTLRERPDWNAAVTIEVRDELYRLAGVEERPDGRWKVLAYRLTPAAPNEVVRGLVRYDPS